MLGVYNGTCWCYENHGPALKQCEHFRSKIWGHPCEKKLSNFHVENALLISEAEFPLPLQNTLLFTEDSIDDIDVFSNSLKRTTRSPMATEIQQWRNQLDSALPAVRPQRAELTCHGALYDVCLKHIACRELWKIF
uniref:Uncharacterized protein n=1 Tax=Panagrolaimus sp. PS1159 TaxID=55785 RepID=A0AC35EUZ8_9BILA